MLLNLPLSYLHEGSLRPSHPLASGTCHNLSPLCTQADLADPAGSVPDHRIKVSIVILLLVEGLKKIGVQ